MAAAPQPRQGLQSLRPVNQSGSAGRLRPRRNQAQRKPGRAEGRFK